VAYDLTRHACMCVGIRVINGRFNTRLTDTAITDLTDDIILNCVASTCLQQQLGISTTVSDLLNNIIINKQYISGSSYKVYPSVTKLYSRCWMRAVRARAVVLKEYIFFDRACSVRMVDLIHGYTILSPT